MNPGKKSLAKLQHMCNGKITRAVAQQSHQEAGIFSMDLSKNESLN